MDNYSDEFSDLQKRPNEELQDCCDKLFELFNTVTESAKKKAVVWPLQMMLLVLCPVRTFLIKIASKKIELISKFFW